LTSSIRRIETTCDGRLGRLHKVASRHEPVQMDTRQAM
jgi:hypothetical protein